MKNNAKPERSVYEKPRAVSLSAVVQGACNPGSTFLSEQCRTGGSAGVHCRSGELADNHCWSGTYPANQCRSGANVG